MEFLPCFKKEQKVPTFITIHIIKREDDDIEGEDIDEEDDILKKMKTIKNVTKINDTEYFTIC